MRKSYNQTILYEKSIFLIKKEGNQVVGNSSLPNALAIEMGSFNHRVREARRKREAKLICFVCMLSF